MTAPRWWQLSSWVNDINPVNWKTVLVGYMQFGFFLISEVGWLYFIVQHPEKGMQETFQGIVAGLLAGLSGITLAGRGVDRTTDYGYVERKYAGKAALAQATAPSTNVQTGDGAVNVTATMPVPGAVPRSSAAVPRVSTAQRAYDPGA